MPILAGLALRLWFIHHDPDLTGDPLIYGGIATHLLQHGIYGFSGSAPTLIRLPGYPLFLALCFAVFGIGKYHAVLYLQTALDLVGCMVLSRLAAVLAPSGQRARACAFTMWLGVLCPFTASYTAAPLTETLELLATGIAFSCYARAFGLGELVRGGEPRKPLIWGMALAWTAAALLRPDGALLAVTLCGGMVFHALRGPRACRLRSLDLAAAVTLASLVAFVPWTVRNWHTFHVLQPLAPRYATDPGEPTHPGFQQWTKTVCADFACTAEVYWVADADIVDFNKLPARAFDSPEQKQVTQKLFDDYNDVTTLTPEIDARFGALARERFHDHPIRNHVGMPLLRLADMWFRPRVELFNIDLRWWRYSKEGADTLLALALGALNLGYMALAALGAVRRPPMLGIFATFILLRCALLLTIEAPEARYTLECYPVLLVLGGLALARRFPRSTCG